MFPFLWIKKLLTVVILFSVVSSSCEVCLCRVREVSQTDISKFGQIKVKSFYFCRPKLLLV